MWCSCSGVQCVLNEIHLYEIHLFVLILFNFIDVYTSIHIYLYINIYICVYIVCLYAYSHVCRDVCRGTSPPEDYLTWVYGYKSIWRPDVFLNHNPLFKTYIFIFNYCVWSLDTCMQFRWRPQAQNSLELELPTVVNHLTWVLRTTLGSSARTNCAPSRILYWGGVLNYAQSWPNHLLSPHLIC